MKQINSYIIEKLHINKEFSLNVEKNIINMIFTIFDELDVYNENKKEVDEDIKNWINDYTVEEDNIKFYANKQNEKVFKGHNVNYLSNNKFSDLLIKCDLNSYSGNHVQKYNRQFDNHHGKFLNGKFLNIMGNENGFIVWSDNRTLLIKYEKN